MSVGFSQGLQFGQQLERRQTLRLRLLQTLVTDEKGSIENELREIYKEVFELQDLLRRTQGFLKGLQTLAATKSRPGERGVFKTELQSMKSQLPQLEEDIKKFFDEQKGAQKFSKKMRNIAGDISKALDQFETEAQKN